MSFIELTKSLIENIGGILASVAGVLVAWKGILEVKKIIKQKEEDKKIKEIQKRKKDIEAKNGNTLNNGVEVYLNVRWLVKHYDCNRAMVLGLHDSGEILTPFCDKKITIFYEDTSASTVKEISSFWQGRKVDFEMLRFMDHLNKDEFIHYEDITAQCEDNTGIRELVNAKQGQEIYAVKIGWYGKDKLICLFLQRNANPHNVKLQQNQKNVINYKATEIKNLLNESDFRI